MVVIKYVLTDERHPDEPRLCRIRAVRAFDLVSVGDFGGFVEHARNLSHSGTCWVTDNARVTGSARVTGDTWLASDADRVTYEVGPLERLARLAGVIG